MKNLLRKALQIISFSVICVYEGIPLKQEEHYALPTTCGQSELGLPLNCAKS